MELDSTLRSFWELETLGIEKVVSDPVYDRFASTLQVKDGRYKGLSLGVNITTTFQIITGSVREGCMVY